MSFGNAEPAGVYEQQVIANHHHPVETACAPDWVSRRAGAQFTTAADTENIVLGSVTYTFVATLGTPAASNVEIKVQSSVPATIQKLAQAIRGEEDAANIAYGTSTQPNSLITAFYTGQRFSTGTIGTSVPAGANLFILEKAEDSNDALAFSTTATATLAPFVRSIASRYTLDGNHASSIAMSISGSIHCILPIGSVVLGGVAGGGTDEVKYDPHLMVMTGQTQNSEKEVDIYYSLDEVTFTRHVRSIPVSDPATGSSLHVDIQTKSGRIPAGAGLYVKVRNAGIGATETIDLKFCYHLYPAGLS